MIAFGGGFQRSILQLGVHGLDHGYRILLAPDQIGATPWSDPEAVGAFPIEICGSGNTPTLFIHSDEDYRCWLPEALQMFSALKYHGVDARLCMFRGENHELSRSGVTSTAPGGSGNHPMV